MSKELKSLKAASRRAHNGAWPYIKNYALGPDELQALMDGKSPSYQVVIGQGERALAYVRVA